MKVAIVHDWLVGGGAEWVVYELHKMYPDASIYTSYATDEWRERLDNKVVTGFLQHWPFSKLRKFLPVVRIWWFTHLDLSQYDLVISSTGNGEAKGIHVPNGTHICYCHSPTHFYWRHYNQYLKRPGFGMFSPLVRVALRLLVGPLRRWDYNAAQRPDYFVANSSHIKNDIKTYYGRDAVVIHPPVHIERFTPAPQKERTGLISTSRLVPAKHVDIIVEAANALDLPLTVVSTGPELQHLKSIAGESVTFTGKISDEDLAQRVAHAIGFVFASFDDFGIVPVEAMAAGTPVIAYKAGGALDYVVPGKTGLFFEEQTSESLIKALRSFDPQSFKPAVIRAEAEQFSPQVFTRKMERLIARHTRSK
ncbi:MAG TPA: glycosyltransferase [Candidatus Saccharimonadales bacterium]|nr:glycosyltransferase [Candidatus Saccharimonadales bacterium]